MLQRMKLEVADDDIALKFPLGIQEAANVVAQIASQQQDARVLAELFRAKRLRKFDEHVSEDLLNQAIANDYLDIATAQQTSRSLM